MTSSLLFDFTVDKAAKTVYVIREFDADLSLVWDAFTKQEILDQWWAPHPFVSKTKFMDFKEEFKSTRVAWNAGIAPKVRPVRRDSAAATPSIL